MAAPTITVVLDETVSSDSVTLRAPAPDIQTVVEVPSVTHKTAGGGVAQYRTGAAFFEAMLSIQSMSDSTKNTFEAFYRSHFGKTTVRYTDERGNIFTGVRFLSPPAPVKTAKDSWSVTLHLRLPSVLK